MSKSKLIGFRGIDPESLNTHSSEKCLGSISDEKHSGPRIASTPHQSHNQSLKVIIRNPQMEHAYLTELGLSLQTIRTFGLGFCQKGQFNGRIVIPIHNDKRELIAYAGRAPSDTNKIKYIFSNGFNKSLNIFNLHRAVVELINSPLIIVEGFFDVIKLWQHGLRRVVALMGNSLSFTQEELICRHFNTKDRIIIMLNEDDAGQEAREEYASRLAKSFFVKVHVFDRPSAQPRDLTQEQLRELLAL